VERPAGLRAIITYKLVKVPVMVALALFMTLAPHHTDHLVVRLTHELASGNAIFRHVAHWLEANITTTVLGRARALAWIDAAITLLEAILLIRGKSWGEWLVVGGLGLACVFELVSIEQHVSLLKSIVFLLNLAIVLYLVRLRLAATRRISIA
jgi:uncharacterized membrane protein (DUF2068 family)